jgi:hypothetical protein
VCPHCSPLARDPLDNLCWSNREAIYYAKKGKPGLHSWQYQKAVYVELKKAFDKAGGAKSKPADIADALKKSLQSMGRKLENGDVFW